MRTTGTDAVSFAAAALVAVLDMLRLASSSFAEAYSAFTPTLSARKQLKNAKGYVTGYETWYQEPMHFFGEGMRVPVFGFIPDARATVTGFVNRLPKYRGRLLEAGELVPNPFVMRDGRVLKNPYEGF